MSIIKLKIVNGAETMENIENKTIYLIDSVIMCKNGDFCSIKKW